MAQILGSQRGRDRLARVGAIVALMLGASPATAQVQLRIGDATRTTYSELHEALRDSTPAADSVLQILRAAGSRTLWPLVQRAASGQGDWNSGLIALNCIAAVRETGSHDSVVQWRERIESGKLTPPPDVDLRDLLPGLHAIELELERARTSDIAVLTALLPRISGGEYDLGDAWVFGRLGQGAADTVAQRFLASSDSRLRIRYLTLLSFSTDTSLIPLLARIYVAPDSFNLPLRIGTRASDGLLWIGTRASIAALLDARGRARARGTYADPRLGHADLDFLGSDSSQVISRTGRWLTEWVGILPGEN
ncbi:MAG: hypothetical protein ABI587_15250 [Gemmatimonadales bacterium]